MTSPVIVALDYPSADQALGLAKKLSPELCRVKVGKELFTSGGPETIRQLVDLGYDVFLDLKFHDIPNTVARACYTAAQLGVWMLNVHALGGKSMMIAARQAVDESQNRPKLIAVTVLTSMAATDLEEIGILVSPMEQVQRLAKLAQESGLDGVVCSPQEVTPLREICGPSFLFVTPGVRPAGASLDDQKRIMTPKLAMESGSNYLVVGRPITQAKDPLAALIEINESIN